MARWGSAITRPSAPQSKWAFGTAAQPAKPKTAPQTMPEGERLRKIRAWLRSHNVTKCPAFAPVVEPTQHLRAVHAKGAV